MRENAGVLEWNNELRCAFYANGVAGFYTARYYIRRTYIGEIKDNAKKKILWWIVRGQNAEGPRSREKERKR